MKLLLRRSQDSGLMGGITFMLDVRAEFTDEELGHIKKYKLGKTLVYSRDKPSEVSAGAGWGEIGAALAQRMLNLTISVNDLLEGKQVTCKDIVEMLAAEEQIREACRTCKEVLTAAASFEGETVVEF